MITGLQAAMAGGAITAGAVVALIALALPTQPDLAEVAARLAPTRARRPATTDGPAPAATGERVGAWAMRALPSRIWGSTPRRELALLGIPIARHYAKKLAFAAVALVFVPLTYAILAIFALALPVSVPVIATLALAAVLFVLPDLGVREEAKAARTEFTRALSAYVDLVALERNAGAGPRQAMEDAAEVGDNWVFSRIASELARSRWIGIPPWDALTALSEDLDLPELAELGDIMRLSGEEGTQVYSTLRARSAAMRAKLTSDDLAAANATSEKMTIPMSALALVFLALLIVPSIFRLLSA